MQFPQQTSNPFQTFPWMQLLFPQGQGGGQFQPVQPAWPTAPYPIDPGAPAPSQYPNATQASAQPQLYAGNPFLNMYVPAPNPTALTQASVMPPSGPGGGNIPGAQLGPPPTSATLTPQAAAPGAPPAAQMTPPSSAGTVPGSPGAGGTGLPAAPAAPLPPAQYVQQQQATQQTPITPQTGATSMLPGSSQNVPQGAPSGTYALGGGWFMNPAWQNPMNLQGLQGIISGQPSGTTPMPNPQQK